MREETERLFRLVENDANGSLRSALSVVRSDVSALLSEFMDVRSVDMTVERDGDGYDLYIRTKVNRFYDVGKTTEHE